MGCIANNNNDAQVHSLTFNPSRRALTTSLWSIPIWLSSIPSWIASCVSLLIRREYDMVNRGRGPFCTIRTAAIDITKSNSVTMTWTVTILQSISVHHSGTFPITDLCSNRAFHSFNNSIPFPPRIKFPCSRNRQPDWVAHNKGRSFTMLVVIELL